MSTELVHKMGQKINNTARACAIPEYLHMHQREGNTVVIMHIYKSHSCQGKAYVLSVNDGPFSLNVFRTGMLPLW